MESGQGLRKSTKGSLYEYVYQYTPQQSLEINTFDWVAPSIAGHTRNSSPIQ